MAIPDVAGLSFTKARQLLEQDGFVVAGTHGKGGQTVTMVSPTGEAPAGSTITIG